jgi:CBS domain-containing protein
MFAATVRDIEQFVGQPGRLFSVKEEATVAEAARKMSDNCVGCLVVLDAEDNFTGVVTERDTLAKVTATHKAPQNVLVGQIMTPDPLFCTRDTTLEEIEQLMAEHRIRHLPIVEDCRPIAMISSRDVIAYQLHSNRIMRTAAEQLAMLSTKLKSLNLKDVVTFAIQEVPKDFCADKAVLCLAPNSSSDMVVYRNDCNLARQHLLDPDRLEQISDTSQVTCAGICDQCSQLGGQSPRLIIPLSTSRQSDNNHDDNPASRSFLCMCRLKSSSENSQELQLCKASLLQDILNVNLANAGPGRNYQQAQLAGEPNTA